MAAIIFLLAFVTVTPQSVAAGAGSVSGFVSSLGSGEPLLGVNVTVEGTFRGAATDAKGEFRIPNVPVGTYTVAFSLVGYQRLQWKDIVVREGEETQITVSMKESLLQTEQVVVTASKREQSLQEVPVSIATLDAVEIRARNSVTLDEALRYVPGVNLTGQQINIRGSSGYSLGGGSRVLMLLDGMPFITGDTGELIFEAIPAGLIDRIEVVKGASSALYGSNALGGVVNVITKPIGVEPEASIRMYAGFYDKPTFDQWKWSDKRRFLHGQSAGFGHKLDNFGFSVFVSRQLDDGYRQNDARSRYNIFLKARQEFSSTSALTVNAALLHQFSDQFVFWRNLDSALIPPRTNLTDNIESTRYYVNGTFTTLLSENALLTAKSMWSHNRWGYQQFVDADRTTSRIGDIRADISARILFDDHTLTTGIDANIGVIRGEMFEGRTIGGLALYGQDEIELSRDFTLTLGFRTDFQSVGLEGEAVQFNPKAALSYVPQEGTTLRASIGRGFRVPSLAEAFIAAGGGVVRGVPNTSLKPERSTSYEVGIVQQLWEGSSVDVAAFGSHYDNMIEPGLIVAGQIIQVQWRNVTSARVQGFESAVKFSLLEGAILPSIGYTYVYPEDLTQREILKYRPRHLLYTNLIARMGWLTIGGDCRFVSRVDHIDEELVETGTVPDGSERNDIVVADFRIGANIAISDYSLLTTFNIRNAFQHNYVELIGHLRPPRTYLLSLEFRM